MSAFSPDLPWELPPVDAGGIARLRAELGLGRVAAEILWRRGLGEPGDAERFLAADSADLHDPFLLPEAEPAARRLAAALQNGERIVVHGDYDADGISGAALLCGALRRLGADVQAFVPDRQKDGYGVAPRLIERAGEAGVGLLITVDTGSSAHEELARARELGVDSIVCDHHLFDRRPEGATWLLNPHAAGCGYPNPDLCGVGVAYKLLEGLARVLGNGLDPSEGLDLVALGLLGDQMLLHGENRTLVRRGLERMTDATRPGILALLEVARLTGQELCADDVVYQLAPRINAAGRVERAHGALQLLLTEDPAEARRLAWHLDELNRRRRELDQRVTEEAAEQAALVVERDAPAGLVLASERWPLGVVGIGAARVAERFDRPTVLLSIEGEEARGSARSVPGFDLKAALDECAGHLVRYGGHAAAAGMTLSTRHIEAFREGFGAAAARLPRGASVGAVTLDAELTLAEIDDDLASFLQRLGPFGPGNRSPLLASRALRATAGARVVGQKHLKLALGDGRACRSFIGFRMAEPWMGRVAEWSELDVVYGIRYRRGSPFDPWELTLRGLRPHDPSPRDPEEEA